MPADDDKGVLIVVTPRSPPAMAMELNASVSTAVRARLVVFAIILAREAAVVSAKVKLESKYCPRGFCGRMARGWNTMAGPLLSRHKLKGE